MSIFVNCQTKVGYFRKVAERILFRANVKRVGDSVGRSQESICMKTDSEVTKLNKVAERIFHPANGKTQSATVSGYGK